jgi:Uma2 family endonuclease
MRAKLAEADQMTIEEFLAYMDTRPDGERWELIEGVEWRCPLPTQFHQVIIGHIGALLMSHKIATKASWMPLLGIFTHVPCSPRSLPWPDFIVKQKPLTGATTTDDALVVFEVLSISNTKSDQAWRRRVYASIPNCRHYVTVSMNRAEVIRHDRAGDWAETKISGLDAALALPAIGFEIPLHDIYRWTPVK